ncbi:MAG: phosphate-starvation-inducible PsiE family protein [Poseidonibacter sp.]|uniref:phosphate-starvation-inducible PsiE family protein n=1 Tax=Poseidonibacter sp. TaxID=2321188 RepID=UPI00359EBF2A
MMKFFSHKNFQPLLKFSVTLLFFISVKDFSTIDSFSKLAVTILEFIIILELIRMLIEFLLSDENRIRMRLMIDSTIVFFIRDIMLIVNDTFNSEKVFTILGIIGVLFVFRIIAIKYSPSVLEKDYKKEEIKE